MLMILLQIEPDIIDKLAPHWAKDFAVAFVGACIVGTLLSQVMPPPPMFPWEKGRPYYAFIFAIVQGLSVVRKNWNKNSNGKPDPKNP